jgi:hypothetical protein
MAVIYSSFSWSGPYVTYSVYIKERAIAQQKYSTLYSRNFMEFRAFLPHKPPFCHLIVQWKHNKTINQLGKSQKKTNAKKGNALTQIQELSFSSVENFFI